MARYLLCPVASAHQCISSLLRCSKCPVSLDMFKPRRVREAGWECVLKDEVLVGCKGKYLGEDFGWEVQSHGRGVWCSTGVGCGVRFQTEVGEGSINKQW